MNKYKIKAFTLGIMFAFLFGVFVPFLKSSAVGEIEILVNDRKLAGIKEFNYKVYERGPVAVLKTTTSTTASLITEGTIVVDFNSALLNTYQNRNEKFQIKMSILVEGSRQGDKKLKQFTFDECYIKSRQFTYDTQGSVITTYAFTAVRVRESG